MPQSSRFGNAASPQRAPDQPKDRLTKRQYVRFAFYKLDPAWRRLSAEKQAAHKRELIDTIEGFKRRMLLRPYSLMGTRADAELLLWQIAESPQPFGELATAIARTGMGAYLQIVYSYFSQTKRSIYEIRGGAFGSDERLIIQPSEAKYLFRGRRRPCLDRRVHERTMPPPRPSAGSSGRRARPSSPVPPASRACTGAQPGRGSGFTVPAMNLRAQTFDMARTMFGTAGRDVGPLILEIAGASRRTRSSARWTSRPRSLPAPSRPARRARSSSRATTTSSTPRSTRPTRRR